VKKFKLITNSSEPKIIGTRNGIFQIEFTDEDLEKHPSSEELDRLFISPSVRKIVEFNKEVQALKIHPIKGELIKRAKITDFMGFCPYFFGCNYLISEKVVEAFRDTEIDKSEINLLPVELQNENLKYFILFVPMIPHEEIIFKESLIYPSRQQLLEKKDYFDINSFKDYNENIDKSIFMNFEKVVPPKKYEMKDIICIQGISSLFFSDKLVEFCLNKNMTSFQVSNRKIEISFN